MKRLYPIVRTVICAACLFLAMLFLFIEGWLLFSGDWLLFEHRALTLVQVLARCGMAAWAFAVALCALIHRERDLTVQGVAMLAAALVSVPLLSNGFGLYLVLICALFLLTERHVLQRLRRIGKKKDKT